MSTFDHKYDKVCTECLVEMFKRVGLVYPDKKFTDQPEWYCKRSWTEAEQEDFRKWMKKKLKKSFPTWRAHQIDKEVGYFTLMWCWTTNPERVSK